MSDANVFARFIHEMRALLTAIESHVVSLSAGAPAERRPHALLEMARLSHAAAALAQAFEVDELRALADALSRAGASAAETSETDPLAPPGAYDMLAFMKWRLECLATAGRVVAPTDRERAVAHRLEQSLHAHPADAELARGEASPISSGFAGAGPLTADELALIQSFPSASLRRRDEQADARLLARVTGAPAFMAQTHSGADVPVFGGLTADELDEIPPEMKRMFTQETQVDLRNLGELILDFEQQADKAAALESMGYIAHKIKGSAATMGFPGFSAIAACLQETIETTQGRGVSNGASFVAGLGHFLDICERALEAATALAEPPPQFIEKARALRDALTDSTEAPTGLHSHPLTQVVSDAAGAEPLGERSRPSDYELVLHIEAHRLDALMNQMSALAANRGAVTRNRSDIAHAQAEMQAALIRLREKSAQITDAHPLTFDNLFSAARPGGQSGPLAPPGPGVASASAPLDASPVASASPSGPLRASWSSLRLEQYTEVDTALRALAEVVADVTANYGALAALLNRLGQLTEAQEALSREIQTGAMSIRLAQLVEITPRLHISARVAATALGKQVEFEVRGDAIEFDRSLLEALEDPLIQMVRNAIAHGIETPEERLAAGKPAKGRVWIHAYNAGNEVVIEVGDDGRGVNAHLLKGVAIGKQLITPEDARQFSQEQALNLMFQQGVTTLGSASSGFVGALAGSGIGLANVADKLRLLKGSITVRSDPNQGTLFQIRAPISLSMLPVLEVSAGDQVFALPFTVIESTAIISPENLRDDTSAQSASGGSLHEWRVMLDPPDDDTLAALREIEEAQATISDVDPLPQRQTEIPAYALAETLGFEQDVAALRHMIIIQLRGQPVALLVEAVSDGDVREATVRPLPLRLQRRVARGVVVRPEDGDVALLIDPQEALAQRLAGADIALRPANPPVGPRMPSPSVLIVDDSVTIRRTLEQALTASGFKTRSAHDGYEALELMEHELPRVIVLDVEMPRLSGFELLTIMRSSPQYQRVRVAMLTSRAADKHRDYALALGADAYLVKPCPQETIVETIRRLLTESEPE